MAVRLHIVILNYRVTDLTMDCLRSLQSEVSLRSDYRVSVLENGTGGDAHERLRQAIVDNGWGSWVDLTQTWPNRGFTGGNNIVIRAALEERQPPDYFLLLNADTVVRPGALDALVRFMDGHPRAGIAGSQLLSPDGAEHPSSFRYQGIASELDRGLRLGVVSRLLRPWAVVPPLSRETCEVQWVSGASMILRRQMLVEVGLLDEGLYTYYDDIDICLRARRHGWETWVVPESRVVHLEGASTGINQRTMRRRPDYWFQARRRYFLKNHGAFYTALVDAAYIGGLALWQVRRRIQRKPDSNPPHMLHDAWRHSVFVTGFGLRDVENPALRSQGPGAGEG